MHHATYAAHTIEEIEDFLYGLTKDSRNFCKTRTKFVKAFNNLTKKTHRVLAKIWEYLSQTRDILCQNSISSKLKQSEKFFVTEMHIKKPALKCRFILRYCV